MVTTEWIRKLIADGELWRFYKTKEWKQLKQRILAENHYECSECKKRGVITRYDVDDETGERRILSTVHHVQHVREHPELALSEFYFANGERRVNLIPVCKACHNRLHPEKRGRRSENEQKFTNVERW